jgi:hypothetical protein
MVRKGDFTPQSAVRSLEVSLRELGTEFIDIFFLHEATLADAASEPLIETLQQQVSRGTIRTFGVASAFPNFQADAARVPSAFQVLQFEGDAVSRNVSHLAHSEGRGILTHSIFKPFSLLRAAIKSHPAVVREYSSRMDLDLTDSNVIGSMLLHGALRENPRGVVLFSSLDAERVEMNVRNAQHCPYNDQQLSFFVEFAESIL